MRWWMVICAAVLLSGGTMGWGQQVGPKVLDKSFARPGARALGMGGAYLLVVDDATAGVWNPAALVEGARFNLEVVGRTNFDVRDITDLVDDLEDIRDQIDTDNIAAIQDAFNRVRDWARRRPTLRASLAPIGGISSSNLGLFATSVVVLQAETQLDVPGAFGLDPLPSLNLYVRGGAIALSSIGIAYARSLPAGLKLGIAVRRVRADFAGFLLGATTDPTALDPVIGQAFDRVDKSRFTADIGAIWEPPVQPPQMKLRYAAVVRNALPVKFSLPAVDLNGNPVAGYDFTFRLNPEIDLGVLVQWRDRTYAVLELHNTTSANGGDMTVHAGIEHWLAGNVFAVRVGYDDDKPVVGLGINLKFLRIDLATGPKPKERLAVGISLRF